MQIKIREIEKNAKVPYSKKENVMNFVIGAILETRLNKQLYQNLPINSLSKVIGLDSFIELFNREKSVIALVTFDYLPNIKKMVMNVAEENGGLESAVAQHFLYCRMTLSRPDILSYKWVTLDEKKKDQIRVQKIEDEEELLSEQKKAHNYAGPKRRDKIIGEI